MYTIINDRGLAYRNSDKVIVVPRPSAEDQLYKDYVNWVYAGNQPTIVDTDPDFVPGILI